MSSCSKSTEALRRIWPRAQSKLYEEPKKLVAHGFARATDDSVGRRRRTRYTITPKGRRALAAWLQEPGDGPVLEFEQLLKISLSDSGTKADILTNLDAARCLGARPERGEPGHRLRLSGRPRSVPATRRRSTSSPAASSPTSTSRSPGGSNGHLKSWRNGPTTCSMHRSTLPCRRGQRPARGEHRSHSRPGRCFGAWT